MWYLIVLLMWRLVTPILKLHWLFLPASVVVSLVGGLWNTDALMIPRFLGLLPFFVLGLHLKPRHLQRLDDHWVRLAAIPALLGIGAMARYTDTWAQTALLWYDAGYDEIPIDNEIVFQTRLTVMMFGLLGAFSVLALVPRRPLGWFTTMGTATMVVYLFHGFVIKTAKALGWPEWASDHIRTGFVLTTLGAIALTLLLASPPVRRVLEPLTDPLGHWSRRRSARSHANGSAQPPPVSPGHGSAERRPGVARDRPAAGPAPHPGGAVAVGVVDQVAHPAQRQRHQPVRAHAGRAERAHDPRHGGHPGEPAGDRERLAVVLAQQAGPRGRGRVREASVSATSRPVSRP